MSYSSYADLIGALRTEFGTKDEGFFEQFFRVHQGAAESVTNYGRRVSQLHSKTSLPESYLKKCFVAGLLGTLYPKVHASSPTSFNSTLEAAKYQEDALADSRPPAYKLSVPGVHVHRPARPPPRDHGPAQPAQQQQQQQQQQQHRAPAQAPRPPGVNDLANQMSRLSLRLAQLQDPPAVNLYEAAQLTPHQELAVSLRACLLDTQLSCSECYLELSVNVSHQGRLQKHTSFIMTQHALKLLHIVQLESFPVES